MNRMVVALLVCIAVACFAACCSRGKPVSDAFREALKLNDEALGRTGRTKTENNWAYRGSDKDSHYFFYYKASYMFGEQSRYPMELARSVCPALISEMPFTEKGYWVFRRDFREYWVSTSPTPPAPSNPSP